MKPPSPCTCSRVGLRGRCLTRAPRLRRYGLIFLFRWSKTAGAVPPVDEGGPRYYDGTGEVYFANQVINNACATQAIIHILLNSDDKLDIGPTLTGMAPTKVCLEQR